MATRYLIVGGAGFIGSHFTDRLLGDGATEAVTIYDNFSSGREWHYARWVGDPRLRVLRADVHEHARLVEAATGHEVVIHLASNPDIARAVSEPAVDFDEGTVLTHAVLEAMRNSGASTILYASGSGVYGDLGEMEATEDHGPLVPISTYGASKLAGEALIAAYCHMFGLVGRAFRFGNVVGPRQTHGVGLDFVRRLMDDPPRLRILGDGRQSKSYVHVSDIVEAVIRALERETLPFQVYNVATLDYVSVLEIADLAVEAAGLAPGSVAYELTGGDRGWKGDVPVVRLNSERIRALGWSNRMTAAEALRSSVRALRRELEPAAAG